MKINWFKALDFIDHVGGIFGYTFLGLILAAPITDLSAFKSAAVAGGLAAGVYVKTQLGTYLGAAKDAAAVQKEKLQP